MRWCAALALVLVALVVMTVKTIRRPHERPAPVEREAVEIAPPAPPTPSPERRASSGIAHLRGWVVPPAGRRGGDELDDDLKVTADDGRRTFDARTTKGGGFAFHMPPGRYTLTAWADNLVGELRDVFVTSDAEREVEIPLVGAAKIAGVLHVPDDADVTVIARPAGSDRRGHDGDATEEAFEIEGLIPGRRYDVEFSGDDIRTLKLTGVRAPSEALDVKLEARAVVHVAVGFPAGERCPIDTVTARLGGGDDEEATETSGDPLTCQFEVTAPVDAGEITVVAEGGGWLLETSVMIPEHGDPEPLCLNPPCRANPLEGLARLRLALDGVDHDSSISAYIVPVKDPDGSSHGCDGSAGRCDIERLRPGDTFSVRAGGDDCRAEPVIVTIVAGDNHVRLPCRRQRRIEGVIRIHEGLDPDRVVVRCAGGDSHPMNNTRLFRLTCGADVAALEYQIGSQGTWRSIPIASLANPAFVDIGPF
jgi:hypothetical protein